MENVKFNPDNLDILTYGQVLEPAMRIVDIENAKEYLNDYIEWQSRHMDGASGQYTAEQICKMNIGYFAGYYSNETRERVERLFMCSHPVFGSISKNGIPTNHEAILTGKLGITIDELRCR